MSLRYQINLGILTTLLIVLLLAGGAIVLQAREAVQGEVQASINLAVQLLKLGINKSDHDSLVNERNLQSIVHLKQTRHLNIGLMLKSGKRLQLTGKPQPVKHEAPSWFVWAIAPPYRQNTFPVLTRDKKPINIIITADARDEINEAWQEARLFLGIILLLNLGLVITVNLLFKQVLNAVATILQRLKEIEGENYQTRLPHFKASEFEQIAIAINHLTASLEKSRQENAALTQHSLDIQETERQHLAQELHDELGQSLTAIKVMAVASKQDGSDRQAEIYQSIVSVCDHLFSVVRSMMKNLHPLMLKELGLTAALEDLVHHWQVRMSHCDINIDCDRNIDRLDSKVAIQIFRIIQEGITNTMRHAKARRMTIAISICDLPENCIKIVISDDGIGCESESLKQGFGLLGIQTRVGSLNGRLQVITAKGSGMILEIKIPTELRTGSPTIKIIDHDRQDQGSSR